MPAEHRLLTWTAEEQTSKQRHTPKSEASMRTPPGRLRGIRRSIIHLLFTEKLWLQVLADPTSREVFACQAQMVPAKKYGPSRGQARATINFHPSACPVLMSGIVQDGAFIWPRIALQRAVNPVILKVHVPLFLAVHNFGSRE